MAEGQADPDLANLHKLNPVPASHKVLSVRPNAVYELNTLACEAINLLASMIVGLREIKQKTAYEIGVRLVGSEMCIRDSPKPDDQTGQQVDCFARKCVKFVHRIRAYTEYFV